MIELLSSFTAEMSSVASRREGPADSVSVRQSSLQTQVDNFKEPLDENREPAGQTRDSLVEVRKEIGRIARRAGRARQEKAVCGLAAGALSPRIR